MRKLGNIGHIGTQNPAITNTYTTLNYFLAFPGIILCNIPGDYLSFFFHVYM